MINDYIRIAPRQRVESALRPCCGPWRRTFFRTAGSIWSLLLGIGLGIHFSPACLKRTRLLTVMQLSVTNHQ